MAWWFLTNCASSRITPAHGTDAVGVGVEPEQRVRRDDDVGLRELADRPPATSRSVSATAETASPGAKRAASPTQSGDDARRRDDEERAETRVAARGHGRRARAPAASCRGPCRRRGCRRARGSQSVASQSKPVSLVGPELARSASAGSSCSAIESSSSSAPTCRCHPCACSVDDAERGELGPQARLVAADPQRRRRAIRQRASLVDQLAQRLQPRLEQREVRAVRKQHLLLAACERREHLGERQLASVDGDRHAEVEPVALAGELPGRDARSRSDSPTSR